MEYYKCNLKLRVRDALQVLQHSTKMLEQFLGETNLVAGLGAICELATKHSSYIQKVQESQKAFQSRQAVRPPPQPLKKSPSPNSKDQATTRRSGKTVKVAAISKVTGNSKS